MRPWIRWISRIAIAMGIIAAPLMLPMALLKLLMFVASKFAQQTIPAPSSGMVIVAAVEAALLLLVTIWWLWWKLPQRQVALLALKIRDPKARADTEDNFRKTIGQALGG